MFRPTECAFCHHWFKKLLLEGGSGWRRDLRLSPSAELRVLTCGQVTYTNLPPPKPWGTPWKRRAEIWGNCCKTVSFEHDGTVAWRNYQRLWLPEQTCRIWRPSRVLHGWGMGVPRACPRWGTPGSWRILEKGRHCSLRMWPPEGVRGEYDQYALFEILK